MIVAPERDVPGISAKACATPDFERVLPAHVVDRLHRNAVLTPFRPQDHECSRDERDGHRYRLEERGLDVLAEDEAEERGRQERDGEIRDEAVRRRIREQAAQHAGELAPILPHHRQHRTGLDHDLEDLALLVIEAEQIAGQYEVAGAGDGQKLGQPLDDAEDHRLPDNRLEHGTRGRGKARMVARSPRNGRRAQHEARANAVAAAGVVRDSAGKGQCFSSGAIAGAQ